VKVVYCLHALAEECHTKKLAPFFTGAGKEERQQTRGDWIKKARQSMRKGLKVADGFNLEAPAIAPMDGGAGVYFIYAFCTRFQRNCSFKITGKEHKNQGENFCCVGSLFHKVHIYFS
jgi:hypothetical protein